MIDKNESQITKRIHKEVQPWNGEEKITGRLKHFNGNNIDAWFA